MAFSETSLWIGLLCISMTASPVTEWVVAKVLLKNWLEQGAAQEPNPLPHGPTVRTVSTVLRKPTKSNVSPKFQRQYMEWFLFVDVSNAMHSCSSSRLTSSTLNTEDAQKINMLQSHSTRISTRLPPPPTDITRFESRQSDKETMQSHSLFPICSAVTPLYCYVGDDVTDLCHTLHPSLIVRLTSQEAPGRK